MHTFVLAKTNANFLSYTSKNINEVMMNGPSLNDDTYFSFILSICKPDERNENQQDEKKGK